LRPFDEADHLLFFGRNEQTNELLMRLEDSAFVAVVGSSGSGKSSLVRAGLLPLLRDGFLFGTENWKIAVARPVNKPYQRLARKLKAFREDITEDEVLRLLRSSDDGLLLAVDAVCSDRETHVLVVIDQFEELFGFRRAGESQRQPHNCASRDEAAAFVAMLLASARKSGDRLRIMITMRSDFVGDCEVFLGLPQAVSQSQFLVPRLTRSQMEKAITGPSRISQAGFEPFNIEPGLITTLTNDAGDRPDQLPLLQHALMRTWKLSDRKYLTAACYTKAGRIEKALSNDAHDAWSQLGEDDKQLARQMFLLLCDVSQEG
jgi:energy-coupling factor transporter ATP-binding protein EcfA2